MPREKNGETISYRGSTITAEDALHMAGGKDTNIIGSQTRGENVKFRSEEKFFITGKVIKSIWIIKGEVQTFFCFEVGE